MEYKQIFSNEKGPKRSESVCQTICSWFMTLLVWISFAFFVFSIIEGIPTGGKIFFGAVFGIFYISYLKTMFHSPTFQYLKHKNAGEVMYAKMGTLFKTPPDITFYAECYHYEYHIKKTKYSDGTTKKKTDTTRVTTYRESSDFSYYSARDVSGLFFLNIGEAMLKSRAYIELKLDTEIDFADSISYSDYVQQRSDFCRRNERRDLQMDFSEKRTIPGLKKENLIQLTDDEPACVSSCLYGIFAVLMLAQFYKLYVNSYCIFQHFTIRKIVSTRYNLMSEEYSQKYSYLSPELNLFQQLYTYEPEDTGNVFEGNRYRAPSKQELERARQYKDYVPSYLLQSAGGNVVLSSDQLKSSSQVKQNPQVTL